MMSSVKSYLRRARRFFSRSRWAITLLRLSRLKRTTDKPGLVMIQIDGLSHLQLQRALLKKRMPFLNSLLQKERYILHPFYAGLPSNTPAVQGELFYGVKTCVPAFNFMDKESAQTIKMFDTPYVVKLEEYLKTQGPGLLEGGSAYSNIFTGGAKEPHFCWAKLGWGGVLHAVNPLVFPFLVILYLDIFVRTFLLLIIEFFLALYECLRGTLKGRSFFKELEFVWLRVLICVFLRELLVVGACMDIMRGIPVIHLNFLGYDEQAHCRGPSSRYAHWSLQGIDDAIRRIYTVSNQSPCREYDLWVYSDHGQEKTTPYLKKYGRTLEEAVKKLFGSEDVAASPLGPSITLSAHRVAVLKGAAVPIKASIDVSATSLDVVVTAMGPLGHIYVKKELSLEDKEHFSKKLVEELGIPLVMTKGVGDKVLARTPTGIFVLPEQLEAVFGSDHPFIEDMKEDVMSVCHHANAGEFVIWGWSKNEDSISFPLESGGHAGAGAEETKAFALLPMDAPLGRRTKTHLRALDLRQAAQNFLNWNPFFESFKFSESIPSETLRVMSYNVHGCKGMDAYISTDRIARVIARHRPDVVALQELDVARVRSSGIDQVERIARRLEMAFHFHPAFHYKDEQYGNAILSRHPMALIKKEGLPKLYNRKIFEPRGAMWVAIQFGGVKVNVINCHLSIWAQERPIQANALLSENWLGHADCQGPVVLCGDFNMIPLSPVFKKICRRIHDSQAMLEGHRPRQTWFAGYPVVRIDHVFLTSDFDVKNIHVPGTSLDKMASDHLPLIVDVKINKANLLKSKHQLKEAYL